MRYPQSKIISTFLALMIAVLIAEIVSMAWAHLEGIDKGVVRSERHLYDPYRGHRLNPDYRHRSDTGGIRIHSSDGFRENKPIAKSKSDNTYRIIMMGGSALYGIGSSRPYPFRPSLMNNETIDAYLEDLLNHELKISGSNRRVEIVNAGVTAYQTFQHLVYLNESLYQYEPDLVLFLDGHNDYYISRLNVNPWMDYVYSSIGLAESFNNRYPIFTMYTAIRPLSQFSYSMTLLQKGVQRLWERYEALPTDRLSSSDSTMTAAFDSQYERVAHHSFLRAYAQIKALGDYYGFKMVFFLQPEIIFESPSLLSSPDVEIRRLTELLRNQANPNTIATMHRIRPMLPRLFKDHGFNEFYDIGQIGSPEHRGTQLYLDYCHLTPTGSKVVAGHIFAAIRRMVIDDIEHYPNGRNYGGDRSS